MSVQEMQSSVLIVEDDPATRRLIEASFALSGFATIQAHNGNQAFEKAVNLHPALAVIDLWIPGIDGFTLTQKLEIIGLPPAGTGIMPKRVPATWIQV